MLMRSRRCLELWQCWYLFGVMKYESRKTFFSSCFSCIGKTNVSNAVAVTTGCLLKYIYQMEWFLWLAVPNISWLVVSKSRRHSWHFLDTNNESGGLVEFTHTVHIYGKIDRGKQLASYRTTFCEWIFERHRKLRKRRKKLVRTTKGYTDLEILKCYVQGHALLKELKPQLRTTNVFHLKSNTCICAIAKIAEKWPVHCIAPENP